MRLTKGRNEPCNDNIGGVKEIYLTTYVEYNTRTMAGYRNLLLTSFPVTQIYKYEGQEKLFTETYSEDGFYSQEVSLKLNKQNLNTAVLLSVLTKNKVRAIVIDWLGNTKVAGLVNGLDVEIESQTGGAKSDFNGYNVRLSGQEEFKAPFVDGLEDAGLTDKQLDYGCILASSDLPCSSSIKISDCNAVNQIPV